MVGKTGGKKILVLKNGGKNWWEKNLVLKNGGKNWWENNSRQSLRRRRRIFLLFEIPKHGFQMEIDVQNTEIFACGT